MEKEKSQIGICLKMGKRVCINIYEVQEKLEIMSVCSIRTQKLKRNSMVPTFCSHSMQVIFLYCIVFACLLTIVLTNTYRASINPSYTI